MFIGSIHKKLLTLMGYSLVVGVWWIAISQTIMAATPNRTNSAYSLVNHYQPNADQNDASYWQRASSTIYLLAQTSTPPSITNGTSFITLDTLQTVHLFAYSQQMNMPKSGVIWLVNSTDAHIITDGQNWEFNHDQMTEGDFVASAPGVYTIQAYYQGKYSVPLVLVVGLKELSSHTMSIAPTRMGIQPFPKYLRLVAPTTKAGVTFYPYPAQGNWIPIKGSTTLPVSMMNVLLNGTDGQTWSYRLPVVNGQFSVCVEWPFTGVVKVILFPHFFQAQTKNVEEHRWFIDPKSAYSIDINGTTLDPLSQAVLASAYRDDNVSAQFAAIASTLVENSPTMDTAIEALSNYASSSITYNLNELHTVNYVWQDAWSAWQSHSGVCTDYSNLAASLMQSVGIPTQTLLGWANGQWTSPPTTDSAPGDSHQWDQAWDGSQWIVFDPTWTTDDMSPVPDYVSNEFFTATQSLNDTHLATPSQVGTAFAGHVAG